MRISRRSVCVRLTLCAGLMALSTLGCQSTPKKSAGEGGTGTGTEFSEGETLEEGVTEVKREPGLETIYFDFDRANIRDDAVPLLRTNATAIQKNPSWGRVTIEGNCDERGSEEYNLALGERRADSVKRYLIDLGVPATRLDTVSFGEAKPAVPGHDESAWRWNRRADFATAH
jgi:peptidoglycan-associated lipoprotein